MRYAALAALLAEAGTPLEDPQTLERAAEAAHAAGLISTAQMEASIGPLTFSELLELLVAASIPLEGPRTVENAARTLHAARLLSASAMERAIAAADPSGAAGREEAE